MNDFPFTKTDWQSVVDATSSVTNAVLVEDCPVVDSLLVDLQMLLADLRAKYGDHPVLLETEADFCDDRNRSLCLYAEALTVAQRHGLPTVSICLSYARLLIDQSPDYNQARMVLASCRDQIESITDKSDAEGYQELLTLIELRSTADAQQGPT